MSYSELDNWCKMLSLEPDDFNDDKGHFICQDFSAVPSSCLLPLMERSVSSPSKSLSVYRTQITRLHSDHSHCGFLLSQYSCLFSVLYRCRCLPHAGRLYCSASCLTLRVSRILITLLSTVMVVYLACHTTGSARMEKVFPRINQMGFHVKRG